MVAAMLIHWEGWWYALRLEGGQDGVLPAHVVVLAEPVKAGAVPFAKHEQKPVTRKNVMESHLILPADFTPVQPTARVYRRYEN
jgi:hypothetical protein